MKVGRTSQEMNNSMKRFFVILIALLGFSAFSAQAAIEEKVATLKPGADVFMGINYVRYNTVLKADFTFTDFSSVMVGRGGEGVYRAHWIEVTPVYLIIRECSYVSKTDENGKKRSVLTDYIREAYRHGLAISTNLGVTITAEYTTGVIELISGSQKFSQKVKWFGGGASFARNCGNSPVDVKLSFERKDAGKNFWFYGDSYASYGQTRWLYHAKLEGFDNWMMDNWPGSKGSDMLTAFMEDLKFGTPKYAVWMLGMNDRNDKEEADPSWVENLEDFLHICKKKKITPIITAVPYVPERKHSKKIEYARERGVRVLDWAAGVESMPDGSWAEKCLSKDKVHPTREGAIKLWEQIKKDIPEVMQGNN